jgi:hypothetical protein
MENLLFALAIIGLHIAHHDRVAMIAFRHRAALMLLLEVNRVLELAIQSLVDRRMHKEVKIVA